MTMNMWIRGRWGKMYWLLLSINLISAHLFIGSALITLNFYTFVRFIASDYIFVNLFFAGYITVIHLYLYGNKYHTLIQYHNQIQSHTIQKYLPVSTRTQISITWILNRLVKNLIGLNFPESTAQTHYFTPAVLHLLWTIYIPSVHLFVVKSCVLLLQFWEFHCY